MNDPNGGCMAVNDLRDLIENRIPENRQLLETSHGNLENVASYCESNYLNAVDKNAAFEETKQFTLQSLASVAYQINTLARDLLDLLSLETDKISGLAADLDNVNMIVNIHKEKMARREIGALTMNKSIPKQPKIISPAVQETIHRYKRTPIDFSLLDNVGHGVRISEPSSRSNLISRAGSTISAATNHYNTGHYERTANIGHNTLSRSSLRSGPFSLAGANDHYRTPAAVPMLDPSRYASSANVPLHMAQGSSEYGSQTHNMSTPTSADYASQQGSDYGGIMGPLGDRYGTIRARNVPSIDVADGRISPALPPPPPQLSQNHYGYGMINRNNELPPPPAQLLNSTHEDEMDDRRHSDFFPPPPPAPLSSACNYFDSQPDWVPRDGTYIEKAVALYDYDADKPDELTLRENCVVYVMRKNEDGWFEGVLDGVTGLFPGNYVRAI